MEGWIISVDRTAAQGNLQIDNSEVDDNNDNKNDHGAETCEMDNVFPPDDLWFGSDTYTKRTFFYNLHIDVYMTGHVICI